MIQIVKLRNKTVGPSNIVSKEIWKRVFFKDRMIYDTDESFRPILGKNIPHGNISTVYAITKRGPQEITLDEFFKMKIETKDFETEQEDFSNEEFRDKTMELLDD